ncbi:MULTISPECIES: ABC transporter substrate-binding protein [Komagataeibacter]|uniref:Extracellular solute-binding protein family 5 n=2 Tax=Komagataeibacter TaxID=1434011 RepID=A0A0D6Q932_KOMXY|nr:MULTISPECIES: ABC transporter substrate-binding protein [Komagataeibacter]MBL7233051.1 ABC transporter substrate-binding protein [Komagataeibacter oboediens]MBT0675928.1 ABC transporter substrate-binding protein [Komagataeibacter oboediens]MBT0677802.1 ABC transporter substrate-binding protein [Komagataeibacter oboediens]MBV0888316.1 ABC transporter substrate-binding protein [Komagataeibacter oboediens]MCK9820347.1 ABC transporter substrate-binding protein [Komagataeibacter oboediens]
MTGSPRRLRIGVHYEPSNIDPHLGAAELALQMTNGIFDTLVNKTVEGDYLPGLADSFSISDDQCRYTFSLRRDVRFHDGTPFDAQAVQASLDRAHDPANRSQLSGALLGPYRQTNILDAHTVEIILDQPYALFLDALSQGWLAPVSPASIHGLGPDFCRHPVGTGPFRFERWDAGNCLVITRNDDYAWAPALVENRGPAHLDEIVFRFIPDDGARTEALLTGEVDAIFAANPADAAALRNQPGLSVVCWPIRGVPVSLMMNTKRAPTDNIHVRQAISYALDVDSLVTEIFSGEFTRAYGPVSQYTLGYEPRVEKLYHHDIEKARTLLDGEGWLTGPDQFRHKDGRLLEVVIYVLPVNFYPEIGAYVKRQLAKVGIAVKVELCDARTWIRAGMDGAHNLIPQGKYASSSQLLSFVYHSRQSGQNGYGWSKRGASDFPVIDELIDSAETCIKPEDYVPIFKQVQMEVMEAALCIPVHCNTNIVSHKNSVTGFRFDAIGAYPLFHDTTITP